MHSSNCGWRGECDGWPAERRTKPPLARTTDCHVYEGAEPVRREQWTARTCSAQAIGQSFSTSEFVRLLAEVSDQPRIRFHGLRHTHATHLLANSVHPKVAQERLGHSNVGTTLDPYSNVLASMQEDAAAG